MAVFDQILVNPGVAGLLRAALRLRAPRRR
jgi:hypothetical protein